MKKLLLLLLLSALPLAAQRPVLEVDVYVTDAGDGLVGLTEVATANLATNTVARVKGTNTIGDGGAQDYLWNGSAWSAIAGTGYAYTLAQIASDGFAKTASDIGLGNVDNTSDANKPVSTATQTVFNKLNYTKIVFAGDSLTSAAGPSAPNIWPLFFLQYPELSGVTVTQNTAVSGRRASEINAAYAVNIGNYAPTASERGLLCILAGTNDLGLGADTAANTYIQLKAIWAAAIVSGFDVCAFTIARGSNHGTAAKEKERTLLNELIKSDRALYKYLVDLPEIVDQYSDAPTDSLHYDANGNRKIAEAVRDVIFYGGAKLNRSRRGFSQMIVESAFSKQLYAASVALTGTGATARGTFTNDGYSGATVSGGTATTVANVVGQNLINGTPRNGWDIDWSQEFVFYAAIELDYATNLTTRLMVGLRTNSALDITTQTGRFAGIEWTAPNAAKVFGANNTTATATAVTTAQNNWLRHVWIHNRGGGLVDVYHTCGQRPTMPLAPLATVTTAPTTTGGSGFSFQLIGTGASASGGARVMDFKLYQ
jgi:hypothetical protein